MTETAPIAAVGAADIDAAARVVAPYAVRTPLLSFPVLNERVGTKVFLKPEMLQRTGSFKFRGAFNKLASIPQDKRSGGVVAFSSGNTGTEPVHAKHHLPGHAVAASTLDNLWTRRDPILSVAYLDRDIILYRAPKFDRTFDSMAQAKRMADIGRPKISAPATRKASTVRIPEVRMPEDRLQPQDIRPPEIRIRTPMIAALTP